MKTILVTGGAGYVGSVLVRLLLSGGYRVRVVDSLLYGGESLLGLLGRKRFDFVKGDIRDTGIMRKALAGAGTVVHLAAIVGDPACAVKPDLAQSINYTASVELYRLAEAAGASRFIFASTCSNYGKMEDPHGYVDESAPLRPVSLYAETKVSVENFLLNQPAGNRCKPACLRFATAYGLSPRIRFDLTVNQFTRELALGRELVVYGAQFWRPYCHVGDLARSVIHTLKTAGPPVEFGVYNVGATEENYQKKMLVDCLEKEFPGARVRYEQNEEDPRDYRVSFARIRRELGFLTKKKVPDGIREIRALIEQGFILDPGAARYSNTGVMLSYSGKG